MFLDNTNRYYLRRPCVKSNEKSSLSIIRPSLCYGIRENPPIHKLCLFEGRFSLLFAQRLPIARARKTSIYKAAVIARRLRQRGHHANPFRLKTCTASFIGYAWQNAVLPRLIFNTISGTERTLSNKLSVSTKFNQPAVAHRRPTLPLAKALFCFVLFL